MIIVLHSSQKTVLESVRYNLGPGFFTLSAIDLLGQIILDCGRAVVLHHPAFPLGTGTFPAVTTKTDSSHFQMSSGGQSCWLKISVPYFFVNVYSAQVIFFFHSKMESRYSLLCLLLFVQNFKYAFPLFSNSLSEKLFYESTYASIFCHARMFVIECCHCEKQKSECLSIVN